ncbi:MAG: WW domain-binding protein 11 [Marteilia pararefringens]
MVSDRSKGNISSAAQARKADKKKEILKNKKNRQEHRSQIFKKSNAVELIDELSHIDDVYFNKKAGNIDKNDPRFKISDLALHEKEKTITKQLKRMIEYYEKNDKATADSIQTQINSFYKSRMNRNIGYQNKIMDSGQLLNIDKIPLPDPIDESNMEKNDSLQESEKITPPSPPSGFPNYFFDSDDPDTEIDIERFSLQNRNETNENLEKKLDTYMTGDDSSRIYSY